MEDKAQSIFQSWKIELLTCYLQYTLFAFTGWFFIRLNRQQCGKGPGRLSVTPTTTNLSPSRGEPVTRVYTVQYTYQPAGPASLAEPPSMMSRLKISVRPTVPLHPTDNIVIKSQSFVKIVIKSNKKVKM